MQFGQFKAVESFVGSICDSSLSFFPVTAQEATDLFTEGKHELKQSQVLSTSKDLLTRSQNDFLRASYSKKKGAADTSHTHTIGVPQELIASLAVDPTVLEVAEQAAIEAEIKEEEHNTQDQVRTYFMKHPDVEARCIFPSGAKCLVELVASNFEWIVTVVSVMATGKVDKTSKIEIRRLMQALNVLHSEVTMVDIVSLGKLLNCIDGTDTSMIYFYDLLAPVKMVLAPPVMGGAEETKLPLGGSPVAEGQSPTLAAATPSPAPAPAPAAVQGQAQIPASPGENKPPAKEEVKEGMSPVQSPPVEGGEENPALDLPVMAMNEDWGDGEFTLVINRCHDCHQHQTYSRHYEEVSPRPNSLRNSSTPSTTSAASSRSSSPILWSSATTRRSHTWRDSMYTCAGWGRPPSWTTPAG